MIGKYKWLPAAGILLVILTGVGLNIHTGCREAALLKSLKEAGDTRDAKISNITESLRSLNGILKNAQAGTDSILRNLKEMTAPSPVKPEIREPDVREYPGKGYVPESNYNSLLALLQSERNEFESYRESIRGKFLSLEEALNTERALINRLKMEYAVLENESNSYREQVKQYETGRRKIKGGKPFGFMVGFTGGVNPRGNFFAGIGVTLGFRFRLKLF